MRAVAWMPNRSFSFEASILSTPRDFRKPAPSALDTHTVSTPSFSAQPLPFQSMKGMQPGLSCRTSDFITGLASVTSFSTASRRSGYSSCTFTPTAGNAPAISRCARSNWTSFRSFGLRSFTRICPVFFEMLTRLSASCSASAGSSWAIRFFQSSDMWLPFVWGIFFLQ